MPPKVRLGNGYIIAILMIGTSANPYRAQPGPDRGKPSARTSRVPSIIAASPALVVQSRARQSGNSNRNSGRIV